MAWTVQLRSDNFALAMPWVGNVYFATSDLFVTGTNSNNDSHKIATRQLMVNLYSYFSTTSKYWEVVTGGSGSAPVKDDGFSQGTGELGFVVKSKTKDGATYNDGYPRFIFQNRLHSDIDWADDFDTRHFRDAVDYDYGNSFNAGQQAVAMAMDSSATATGVMSSSACGKLRAGFSGIMYGMFGAGDKPVSNHSRRVKIIEHPDWFFIRVLHDMGRAASTDDDKASKAYRAGVFAGKMETFSNNATGWCLLGGQWGNVASRTSRDSTIMGFGTYHYGGSGMYETHAGHQAPCWAIPDTGFGGLSASVDHIGKYHMNKGRHNVAYSSSAPGSAPLEYYLHKVSIVDSFDTNDIGDGSVTSAGPTIGTVPCVYAGLKAPIIGKAGAIVPGAYMKNSNNYTWAVNLTGSYWCLSDGQVSEGIPTD